MDETVKDDKNMRSLGFGHRSTGTFVSSKTSVVSVNTLRILPSINPVIRRVTLEIRISRGVCAERGRLHFFYIRGAVGILELSK